MKIFISILALLILSFTNANAIGMTELNSNKFKEMLQRLPKQPDNSKTKDFVLNAKLIKAINASVNQNVKHIAEKVDYWKTPLETLQYGGDCEDTAILKAVALIGAGMNKEDITLHHVRLKGGDKAMAHMILEAKFNGDKYYLDNMFNNVLRQDEVDSYYSTMASFNMSGEVKYKSFQEQLSFLVKYLKEVR